MILIKKHHLLNILLLLATSIAFFSWYSFTNHQQFATTNHNVDAFAINIHAIQFSDVGAKRGEIIAPRLTHFTNNDTAWIMQPLVTLYSQAGKAPWQISAKHGETFNGTQKIDLIDDVVIHQPASSQNADTVITTSLLHILPKQQLATTNVLVTLLQPGINVTSMGMNAYLDQKRVILLSQARGSYDPHTAKSINSLP